MSEFKTKFNLNDEVFIEYKGHILKCRVFGIQVNEENKVFEDKEKPEGIDIDYDCIDQTIYYDFYINQYDNTGIRRRISYMEKYVYATKQDLIDSIEVETFL